MTDKLKEIAESIGPSTLMCMGTFDGDECDNPATETVTVTIAIGGPEQIDLCPQCANRWHLAGT